MFVKGWRCFALGDAVEDPPGAPPAGSYWACFQGAAFYVQALAWLPDIADAIDVSAIDGLECPACAQPTGCDRRALEVA